MTNPISLCGSGTAALALLSYGCTGLVGAERGRVEVQTEYDLALAPDRTYFHPRDLELRSVVGPYAVYEVTGPAPSLSGPRVLFWARPGARFAMLCSADAYFAPDAPQAPEITLQLVGGVAGDTVAVASHHQALQMEDGWTEGRDEYGARVEDPDADPEAADPDGALVEPMSIRVDPAPPMGSLLLLRRVALSGVELGHNAANTIPAISCGREGCTLRQ